MKSTIAALSALFVVAACSSAGKEGAATSAERFVKGRQASPDASVASNYPKEALTFSPSPATALRPFLERLLPNGLRLLFVEDDSLPYVSYNLLIRTGSAEDPKGLSGLANVVSELLDQGTALRTSPQMADALAALGADVGASASVDFSMLSASGLSATSEKLLDLFSEIALQPSFAEGEIARKRKQILAQIESRVDEPDSFASAAWEEYLYGDRPYGFPSQGLASSVEEIKKKNIIVEYKHAYRPNNAILAVTGKYGPDLRAKVERIFGAWAPQEISPPKFLPPAKIEGVKIRLVAQAGLAQAQIRIGNLGIRRDDPDYMALKIANVVLGKDFSSRLMNRVRVKLGLTYSIDSSYDPRLAEGPFVISTFTKPSTVGQTISETIKAFQEFYDHGAKAEEVDRAKAYLKGTFPVAIETAEKFAFNLMVLRLYGVSDTYVSNYGATIDAISLRDINQAITRRMNARDLKILVYGPPEALAQLQSLGAVEQKAPGEILR